MTIEIKEAIIHQVLKQAESQGTGSVSIKPRENELPLDGVLLRLGEDLLTLYRRIANSTGTLGTDPNIHTFPVALKTYIDDESSFIGFTNAATSIIAQEISKAFLASGGYALFLRYKVDSQDFILVAMLKLKNGAGVDAETLSLTETLNIDLTHLHEAARINLSRWGTQQEPYLTFIKGRVKSSPVSDYFKHALACTNFTDSKHHTQEVIRATREFVESIPDIPEDERKELHFTTRRKLFECLNESDGEVPLATIAASVNPDDPDKFLDFIRSKIDADEYQLNDRFTPHKKTYNGLKRINGKIGTISLAFDVADVRSERIRYDPQSDTIVISEPSGYLKKEIQDHESPIE